MIAELNGIYVFVDLVESLVVDGEFYDEIAAHGGYDEHVQQDEVEEGILFILLQFVQDVGIIFC